MISKRRLIMNLTPLLDLIIILFFAQSLVLTDQSRNVQVKLDQSTEILESQHMEMVDRAKLIADLQGEMLRQADEEQRLREDIIEREKAYISAFEAIFDMEMFRRIVGESLGDQTVSPINQAERDRMTAHFAQSFVIMKKSSAVLENHITVWIFYICYDPQTDRCRLELMVNGRNRELSNEVWDFSSTEALTRRLVRELTIGPEVTLPPGPVFAMWGTKGDVEKQFRDRFKAALPTALQDINNIYNADPATGGKGWPNVKIHSGSIAPLGNIP